MITIFTCSIFPQLTRVWFHNIRKRIGLEYEIEIYDCSGRLPADWVKGAKVVKFPNLEHGKKLIIS